MPNPNVQFGAQNIYIPGAYSKIDASQMVPSSRQLANVIAILGDCTGGKPNVPLYFRSGDDAKRVLRSGPLLDAIRMAYDPSLNPDNPGADLIVAMRTNPATQSTLNLLDSAPATAVTLTSIDYGVWTVGITAKVEAGSSSGKKLTISYTDSVAGVINEIYDNLADKAAVVAAVNNGTTTQPASQFVTATVGAGSAAIALISATPLASGAEGTTTSTQYTTCLTLLQGEDVDIVVPITVDQTICAQVQAHVELMSGVKYRKERLAFVGSTDNFATNALYLADLKTNAAALSSSRVVLCAPGIKRPDANGVIKAYTPEYLAATMAGIAAGQEIGSSPTFKYIKATAISFAFTGPDLENLLVYGVSPVQFVKDSGFRVVQAITTWQTDANPMFREFSVRRVGDYVMRSVRTSLERKFTGARGDAATLQNMLEDVKTQLSGLQADRVILGYQNVNILVQNSIARVQFEFAPVEIIDYILITGYAKPGSLAVSFTGQASYSGATP